MIDSRDDADVFITLASKSGQGHPIVPNMLVWTRLLVAANIYNI